MSTVTRQPDSITEEGRFRLLVELERLLSARTQLNADIRELRGSSGHAECAAAASAIAEQAALDHRIDELEAALSTPPSSAPPPVGIIGMGSRISIRFEDAVAPLHCQLVSPIEADSAALALSVESPIGQALLGHRVGDHVEVATPGGFRRIEVVAVVTP